MDNFHDICYTPAGLTRSCKYSIQQSLEGAIAGGGIALHAVMGGHMVNCSTVRTLQYSAVQCSTFQCSTVQYNAVQCSTGDYSAVQCGTV